MKRAFKLLAGAALLGLAGAAAVLYVLDSRGIAPRTLGPYLALRAQGHNPLIESVGALMAHSLTRLDRGPAVAAGAPDWRIGMPAAQVPVPPPDGLAVADVDSLRQAMANASPGALIVLLPGTYRVEGRSLVAANPGRAGSPITVRGMPGAVIESATMVAVQVKAPWWRFEGLQMRGVCKDDSFCEHAFHVVGPAKYFGAVGNTISNYNAHFKINGVAGRFPDHGLIEANTLENDHARRTANPVTPIDLVGASGWAIRSNLIRDFVKLGGNRISYGAFAKGGGADNVIERNVVICEWRLQSQPGSRVGLSLGGGGTDPNSCRDGRCVVEQERGVLRNNLIAACSDDGIYLNNAAVSQVVHNSVIDTGGVAVRFAGSSAQVSGNLVDGPIRARDGAVLHAHDNLDSALAWSYLGHHRWRQLFRAPETLDFGWRDAPPRRQADGQAGTDLCGVVRPVQPAYGAFEDIAPCMGASAR